MPENNSFKLEKHKPVCYTIEDFAPYPCSICGAQCPEEDDLGRHRTTYHGLGTMNKQLRLIFWYDVCPLTFNCKYELDVMSWQRIPAVLLIYPHYIQIDQGLDNWLVIN